ncbi:MAG: PAS domain-containing protein [Candidatus Omnitrophica bacterium]|nr:PAS domain-containing protein [Candidatus Omnitrophota bacterium]
MKHGFLRRILARADKIDKEQIVDYMREIAQERDLLVLIFESMIEGMIVVDADENVVYINQSARRILGLGDGPTVPDQPLKRVLDTPSLIQLCRECMKSGEPVLSRDFHLPLSEGERFLLINTIPLESSRQNLGSLFLFMDVTEQTEQERKLREAEKLAALTTLTAGMSHEIRNPLNSLSIHLQLLKRQLKKQAAVDDSTNETLAILSNEIKRLNGVIETFLAAVRPSKPQKRLISLYALIMDTLKLLGPEFRENTIDVSLHDEGDWPFIQADEGQMKQAVINILRNAIDATVSQDAEGAEEKEKRIMINMTREKEEVTLAFSDTGKGIHEKDLPHIFEPYYTTKPKGSGLGLMIVDRIIREHDGELTAHSKMGKGTQIVISLPVAAESPRLLEHGVHVNDD